MVRPFARGGGADPAAGSGPVPPIDEGMMAKKGGKGGGGDLFELDEIDALLARMGVGVPGSTPASVDAGPVDAAGVDEGNEAHSPLLDAVPSKPQVAPARPAPRRAGLAPDAVALGRVQVSQLLPDDAVVHIELDVPWAKEGAMLGLGAPPELLTGWLQVHKEADEGVVVTGWLQASRSRRCDRCLRALQLVVQGPVQLRYLPESAEAEAGAPSEVGLRPDELDLGWYGGGVLELDAVVCEQLALWAPDPVVCGAEGVSRVDADGGACTVPGAVAEVPGPRPSPFAALAGWRPPR